MQRMKRLAGAASDGTPRAAGGPAVTPQRRRLVARWEASARVSGGDAGTCRAVRARTRRAAAAVHRRQHLRDQPLGLLDDVRGSACDWAQHELRRARADVLVDACEDLARAPDG